jgi:tripartite-type tricarboxylate transporter receptor subunit TctC
MYMQTIFKKIYAISFVSLSFVILMGGQHDEVSGADNFPAKPLEMIVPSAPGGGTDVLARLIVDSAEPFLKQKIVVVNKPGASSTLGASELVKARPDGYTIMCAHNAALTMAPHVIKVNYSLDDFSYISWITKGALMFAVRTDSPYKTAQDVFEFASKNPGKLVYAGEGIGDTAHFSGEKVFQANNVKLRIVPYGGSGESIKALLGGHVDIYGGSVLAAAPHIKAGKVRGLFVTAYDRVSMLPDVPALKDLGLPANLQTVLWRGILAPKGVPAGRLAVLEKAFQQAAQTEKVKGILEKQGEVSIGSTGKEFEELVRSEAAANTAIAKQLGLSPK